MPRNKEYDRVQVLQKAMEIFWKQGFENTSVQDLVDATGLNRFGMYEAFDSKECLFNEALDFYRDNFITMALAPLHAEPRDLSSIRAYFQGLVDYTPGVDDPKGCLMTNTAVEQPTANAMAIKKVELHFDRQEQAFYSCLENAQRLGQIPDDVDLADLVRFFLGVSQGLAVYARAQMSKEYLQSFVDVALVAIPKQTKST